MARDCGCGGATCACLIEAGSGISVSGIGTASDPYYINAELAVLDQVLSIQDSTSINFTVTGSGTIADPMVVTGATIARPFVAYPTVGRPSATTMGIGAYYYDTTLGKPAWSNGSVWKDAAGTTI